METNIKLIVGNDIQITVNLDYSLDDILIDSSHLERYFINIISNAKDAMSQGGNLNRDLLVNSNR